MICSCCGEPFDETGFAGYLVCPWGTVVQIGAYDVIYQNNGLWPLPCFACSGQMTIQRTIKNLRTIYRFICPCGLVTDFESRPTDFTDFAPSRKLIEFKKGGDGREDKALKTLKLIYQALSQVIGDN